MEYSYLELVTSQIDPVHYVLIDGVYHTLTFKTSNKVMHINQHKQVLAKFSYELSPQNYPGPFYVARPQVSEEDYQQLADNGDYIVMSAQVIEDFEQIQSFYQFSEKIGFNYFPAEYLDQIVLVKYQKDNSY